MEAQLLTTIITGVLLAMFTSIIAWQGKGRFDAMDRQFSGRFDAIDRQFESMRAELSQMREEMISMRSDLTHVALVAGAKPRSETG